LRRTQFHMKDTGKSSSRKLRRVIYYTLYRMDPQKTHYKNSLFCNIHQNPKFSKIGRTTKTVYIPPLTPDQPPFKRRLFMLPSFATIVLGMADAPVQSLKVWDGHGQGSDVLVILAGNGMYGSPTFKGKDSSRL